MITVVLNPDQNDLWSGQNPGHALSCIMSSAHYKGQVANQSLCPQMNSKGQGWPLSETGK